ncbi:hypothetical protein [Streptomyces spectabilis]|uniref:Uncharacterized protein n=1 Tax=Streptomyces spectabilis TaxID=68270 RepID=A0A7W8EZ47_STRST|nr:hypothetical protein [Streptomyces spectabilis]MBB5108355.1 hypothetical protein [Streptomyces spectabilis]MCI3901112.1 hypothetical protein [Streptomyces spectabilis]GGV46032.1 hypothetical protein GCM10010245_72170 [Streptomyces spectabilis]
MTTYWAAQDPAIEPCDTSGIEGPLVDLDLDATRQGRATDGDVLTAQTVIVAGECL